MSGTPPQQPYGHVPQDPPSQGPPNQGPPNRERPKRKGPPLVVKILAGVVGFIVLAVLVLGGWILFRPLNKADYSQAAGEAAEAGRLWELLEMTFQKNLQEPGQDEEHIDAGVELLNTKITDLDRELSDIENARVMGKDDAAHAEYAKARSQGDSYLAWMQDYSDSVKPLTMMQLACDKMDADVYFRFEETDTMEIFDEAVGKCEAAARSAVEEAPHKARAEARVAYIDALRAELERFLGEVEKGKEPSSAASQKTVLKIQSTYTKATEEALTTTATESQQESEAMAGALGTLFTHLDEQGK